MGVEGLGLELRWAEMVDGTSCGTRFRGPGESSVRRSISPLNGAMAPHGAAFWEDDERS